MRIAIELSLQQNSINENNEPRNNIIHRGRGSNQMRGSRARGTRGRQTRTSNMPRESTLNNEENINNNQITNNHINSKPNMRGRCRIKSSGINNRSTINTTPKKEKIKEEP